MGIYLSHSSALRYWLTKTSDECVPDVLDARSLASATANMRDIKRAPLPFDYSPERPLHVLVSSQADLRSQLRVVSHCWSGEIPPYSFYELSGPCAVSSPEFTYVQACSRTPLLQAIVIGCYLCGSFAVDDRLDYAGIRNPLTNPDAIRDYVACMSGAPGTRRALQALRYVVPNTASPKEVQLAIGTSLPLRMGGWELAPVLANQMIEVPDRLRGFAGTQVFFGDLYYPDVKGDIEYDSVQYHTGAHRLDHTLMRRNVLESIGIRTVSATQSQICTFGRYSTFMWMVRERFGLPELQIDRKEAVAQIETYEALRDAPLHLF